MKSIINLMNQEINNVTEKTSSIGNDFSLSINKFLIGQFNDFKNQNEFNYRF